MKLLFAENYAKIPKALRDKPWGLQINVTTALFYSIPALCTEKESDVSSDH